MFVGSASLLAADILGSTVYGIVTQIDTGDSMALFQRSVVELLLIVYSTVIFFTVFGLFGYQCAPLSFVPLGRALARGGGLTFLAAMTA